MKSPVYLDNNATTPLDPRVLDAMMPYLTDRFGNASSGSHAFGWEADAAVELAREQVAGAIAAEKGEIIFTSGATEAINLALKGVSEAYRRKGNHLITVETEHKAVLDTCRSLQRQGYEITMLPVGEDGLVTIDHLSAAIREDTILVAVMWANNETGVVQPVEDIYSICRQRDVLFFSDATQAVGKINVTSQYADLLAASAHKFFGPKGAGFLYASRRNPRVRLVPLVDGGGQERNLRGGTLNVPCIVGMGAAVTYADEGLADESNRLKELRDRLETGILHGVPDTFVNGSVESRLPQTTNITFPRMRAADLMTSLRELALSSGSACSSTTGKPSHVLKAMGLSDEEAFSTLRFGLGRFNSEEEIDSAVERIVSACDRVAAEPHNEFVRE